MESLEIIKRNYELFLYEINTSRSILISTFFLIIKLFNTFLLLYREHMKEMREKGIRGITANIWVTFDWNSNIHFKFLRLLLLPCTRQIYHFDAPWLPTLNLPTDWIFMDYKMKLSVLAIVCSPIRSALLRDLSISFTFNGEHGFTQLRWYEKLNWISLQHEKAKERRKPRREMLIVLIIQLLLSTSSSIVIVAKFRYKQNAMVAQIEKIENKRSWQFFI